MIQRLRTRIAQGQGEGGFTLIELLVVIIIIGILLAVAVPSYLGFRDRANNAAAQSNIRAAQPAIEAYFSDNSGAAGDADGNAATSGYQGMSVGELDDIDASVTANSLTVVSVSTSTYCVRDTEGGATYYKNGPAGSISTTACT